MTAPAETYEEVTRRLVGQPEDQRLEFKSGEVLQNDSEALLKEIVGMLNAEGGDIFIGIGERAGRAVSFEGVEDPDGQKLRLKDIVLDTIEPRPRREVSVDSLAVPGTSRGLLVIHVLRPDSNLIYAFRKRQYHVVCRRHGDRLRPLGWEEVLKTLKSPPPTEPLETAKAQFRSAVQAFEDEHRAEPLWLFKAAPGYASFRISLDEDAILKAIEDPEVSGNRRMGWTFEVQSAPRAPRPRHPFFETGRPPGAEGGAYRNLKVYGDGGLEFVTGLDSFEWGSERRGGKGGWALYPHTVVEFPVSLLRLLRTLYTGAPDQLPVLVQMVFLNVQGSTLRPGRPAGFVTGEAKKLKERTLRSPLDPLLVTAGEIVKGPDGVAFRLLRDLYDAFDIPETGIPFFEPRTRRFRFE